MKILFGTLFLLVALEDAIDKDIWRGVPVWEARKSRLNLIYKLSNVLGCIFVCFAIAGRLNW